MKIAYAYIRQSSDESLVEGVRNGDDRAFDALFHRYKEILYRHAYRMVKDEDNCNDIVQDTFLSVWLHRKSLLPKRSIEGYLFKILKNKVLDYLSHSSVRERYADETSQFIEEGICYTEQSVLENELKALINEEKSKLAARTKEVFELNREKGFTYREIGLLLSISEKTAKKQVHNALRVLQTKLTSYFLFLFFLFF